MKTFNIDHDKFRKYMDEAGDWSKDVDEKQLHYFIEWACKCQSFRMCRSDKEFPNSGNIHDAFRGFVMGIKYNKNKNKESP